MRIKAFRHLLAVTAMIAAVFTVSTTPAFGQAFSGAYTFGSSGSTTSFAYNGSVIANLTVGNLTQTGVSPASNSGNFRATNWPLDPVIGTLTGTIDLSKYFQFTLTASPGYTFSLTDLNFGFGRSGTGPRQIQWRSSVDNYAAPISSYASLGTGTAIFTVSSGTLTIQDTTNTGTNVVLALSGSSASYAGLTSVGFRFYAYNAEGSAGTGGLQGPLTFSGVLTAPAGAESFWNGGTWVAPGPGTGGSGTWADGSGSWNPASAAVFGGTAGTVTSGSVTASLGMVFNTSGYVLTDGTITLSGTAASFNSINTGSTTPFSTTINSVLAGSAGMTKAGVGTLTLGGVNTFVGNVAVNAGTLEIAADSALGDATNDIALASATLKTTASVALEVGRDLTGGGTIDIAPGTTLTSSGSVNLSALTLSNGGTLDLQGATRSLGALTFNSPATVNGSGAISATTLTATGLTSGSAIINPALTFATSGNKTVDVGSGGTLVLNGDIAGTTGRISKTGAGTLVVSGSNSTSGFQLGVSGSTATDGGRLILGSVAAAGTATQLQFNSGTLATTAPFTFPTGLSIGGRSNGVAVLGGTNAMTFSGSTSFFKGFGTTGELRLNVNNVTTLAGIIGPTSGSGIASGITIGGNGQLNLIADGTAMLETITITDTLLFSLSGSVGGSLIMAGSAILDGGGGLLAGNLSFTVGSKLLLDVANPTLTVNGPTVSFVNFTIANIAGLDSSTPLGSYDLIVGMTTTGTNGLANIGPTQAFDLGGGVSAYFLPNIGTRPNTNISSALTLMVVPEPGTTALQSVGGLIATGYVARRRRRRRAT